MALIRALTASSGGGNEISHIESIYMSEVVSQSCSGETFFENDYKRTYNLGATTQTGELGSYSMSANNYLTFSITPNTNVRVTFTFMKGSTVAHTETISVNSGVTQEFKLPDYTTPPSANETVYAVAYFYA